MSKSGANAEPSMEEILASIRQIISDDEPQDGAAEASAAEAGDGGADTMSEADLDALFANSGPDELDGDPDGGFDAPAPEASEPQDDNQIDFDAIDIGDEDEPEAAMEASGDADDDEVLDLSSVATPVDDPYEPEADVDFADPAPEPELDFFAQPDPDPEPEPVPVPEPARADAPLASSVSERLLSQESSTAVSAAFADLASTMLSGNARTLEDLVQDMLRPMLKSWLDENLPTMVEKMVREEIERVARRGPRG